ncbi:hypothetical protein PUMCH_001971 [Australozyma saopauloensis]|uniref:Ankyrin n=1 Tax=Australozyma saopauloensis TaxID=291208 RepID=A0AAX4H888_9ASCO|nr:hypothetical protein PUMCH_001971 [[Candida] saopauloensis]
MVANIWVAAADNDTKTVLTHLDSNNFTPNSKDPNGYTAIHAAASYGHIDLLKLLIERGGDINIQDQEGDTPLHHVEDLETAKVIVEKLGGDFKIRNDEGQTAADFIEEEDEFPELAQYLRSLLHDKPTASVNDSLPEAGQIDGHNIRYTMEEEGEPMDEERRKKLEAIVNSENPEEALRELVTSAVRDGLASFSSGERQDEERDTKRNREN